MTREEDHAIDEWCRKSPMTKWERLFLAGMIIFTIGCWSLAGWGLYVWLV